MGRPCCSCATASSLFEPWGNVAWIGRTQPLETVKRIEVVTGPGGVLWGANSFLGIANLITKDAEDVNGLELYAGYGDGPGNKQDFKAYALFGKSFFNGKLKLFQHISYESFIGETFDIPQFLVSSPAPQPGGIAYYRARTRRATRRARGWSSSTASTRSARSALYYMLPVRRCAPEPRVRQRRRSVTTPGTTTTAMACSSTRIASPRIASDSTVKGYGTQFVRDFTIAAVSVESVLAAQPDDPGRHRRPAASTSPASRSSASAAPPTST